MVQRCVGANRALQIVDGTMEIHTMPFGIVESTVPVTEITSLELQRKSVMPPATVGTAALISGIVLKLAEDQMLAIVPAEPRRLLGTLMLGIAAACLVLIVERWLFAKIVVRLSNLAPVAAFMVPVRSARRFVEGFQGQLLISKSHNEGLT